MFAEFLFYNLCVLFCVIDFKSIFLELIIKIVNKFRVLILAEEIDFWEGEIYFLIVSARVLKEL